MRNFLFLLAFSVFAAGCASYDIVQTNIFSDEDGNVIHVNYGRAAEYHINTFESPMDGKEMEFKSKLVIEVTLPDGDEIVAWQCMNFLNTGTMYRTDNLKWMVHVDGFSTTLYLQTEENSSLYQDVYRGILCESPKVDYKPNEKWRTLKKNANGVWR